MQKVNLKIRREQKVYQRNTLYPLLGGNGATRGTNDEIKPKICSPVCSTFLKMYPLLYHHKKREIGCITGMYPVSPLLYGRKEVQQ